MPNASNDNQAKRQALRKYLTAGFLVVAVITLYVSAFWRFSVMHGSP